MVGIVLVSHGELGKGIVSSASMLVSDKLEQLTELSLHPGDNPDEFQQKLENAVKEVDSGDGVFILADMLGGTPCNRALYSMREKVRLLTGLSLPMLYSLLTIREQFRSPTSGELAAIAKEVLAEARDGMVDVNELSSQKS